MTKNATVHTGGKLYVLGEYAILYPGQKAILAYIPIYMTAKISQHSTFKIYSDMYGDSVSLSSDKRYRLIQETIQTFFDFFEMDSHTIPPFFLQITGKMEKNGKKFGIGSSGSVTVLTLKALASFYEIELSKDLLFKLSAYTLLKLGDNGSMGDIACISHEQFVFYQSFDRNKVKSWQNKESIQETIARDWHYKISVIEPHLKGIFMAGWTKVPAISKEMINQVYANITEEFLVNTNNLVDECFSAMKTNNQEALKSIISSFADMLSQLHPNIVTQPLRRLIEISNDNHAVAKSSGAGGGDCGIAFAFSPSDFNEIKIKWQQEEIELLYTESWI